MRGKTAALILAAFALALVPICAARLPAADAPQAQESAKKEPDTVEGRADSMRSVWGETKKVLMKGNVRFTHGDTVLTSDQIEYDENAKIAVSPGKVIITDPQCDISGDNGSAYFKKKVGVLEGNVVMHAKPKKTTREAEDKDNVETKLKEPTTITCARLEYFYKDKVASATGGVVFKQEKRSASAEKAVYDENKELLTLTGNIKGTDEYGQTFSAPGKVVISIKEGDEWMEAQDASATFKVETEEEQPKKK